jgi:hypothetical protein
MTAANGASVTTLALDTTNYTGTDFTLDDIDARTRPCGTTRRRPRGHLHELHPADSRMTNLVARGERRPTLFVQAQSQEMASTDRRLHAGELRQQGTGRIQKVRVHPICRTAPCSRSSSVIPFPTGGDMVGVDIETSRDYQQVEFALTARRYDFEVFCREVLRLKFVGGCWVIRNINSKTSV